MPDFEREEIWFFVTASATAYPSKIEGCLSLILLKMSLNRDVSSLISSDESIRSEELLSMADYILTEAIAHDILNLANYLNYGSNTIISSGNAVVEREILCIFSTEFVLNIWRERYVHPGRNVFLRKIQINIKTVFQK